MASKYLPWRQRYTQIAVSRGQIPSPWASLAQRTVRASEGGVGVDAEVQGLEAPEPRSLRTISTRCKA
eukprot:4616665-Pleurochrysis_carterae.AAC.4